MTDLASRGSYFACSLVCLLSICVKMVFYYPLSTSFNGFAFPPISGWILMHENTRILSRCFRGHLFPVNFSESRAGRPIRLTAGLGFAGDSSISSKSMLFGAGICC